jgi:hypothetical protein
MEGNLVFFHFFPDVRHDFGQGRPLRVHVELEQLVLARFSVSLGLLVLSAILRAVNP